MLSKQHLANPGLRYRQARRDPGEQPPPPVAAAANPNAPARSNSVNPNQGYAYGQQHQNVARANSVNPNARSSQDVWVSDVEEGGMALKPVYIANNAHQGFEAPELPSTAGVRPPSRSMSTGGDDSEFYSDAPAENTPPPQPGAVRMPGLDGQLDDDNNMNIALPPAVDPYHHIVAEVVNDNAAVDTELRDRVANLEEDLKKSYMMLSTHSRAGASLSNDGSSNNDPDTVALRQRLKDLEEQLAQSTHHGAGGGAAGNTSSAHSRSFTNGDSDEFANAAPNEGIVTAPSSRVVVATVDSKPPATAVQAGNSNDEDDDEDDSKGMPIGCKCLLMLLLLGGAGAAVFFLVPFGDEGEGPGLEPDQVTPGDTNATDLPVVTPTLSPTPLPPICPSLNDQFQGNTTYIASGSKNQTYAIDCSIGGDISAVQIDRFTCEPSCAFLLELSAYNDLCVDNTFALDVPDEYYGDNHNLVVGHLLLDGGNVSCANATKYVIPDPTVAPTVAPTAVVSANPTLAVLVPTEPPTVAPTLAPTAPPTTPPTPPPTPAPTATPPPTPVPTPEPTPPPTEPPVDRLDEALNLFFSGQSIDQNSAEYRALEWAAENDSRNAAVESVEFRERFTLANLFYATNGESWTRRSGWTGGDSHCNWESVVCVNGQVSELDLRENNMNGPMIKTWENLALISRLRMSDNAITGTLPTEIGTLSNLGRLELSDNSFSGDFPTHVGNLAQLTNLQIRNNSFRGKIPTHLGRLNRLRSFVAEFNQFTGQIPDELSGMTSLRNIYLGRNQLEGPIPASFGSFTQLTLLSISENRLSGALPAELGSMTNMKRFSAAQNQLSSSIPDDFGAWTAMTYLSVFDNQLTGTIPSSMSQWVNTDTIYFYETSVTGSMNSFCNSANAGGSNFEFYAECGLECSCCTHCCTNQNCQSV
mmetsp:Transcript_33461/g.81013  ORF Transcript_33461/g.81013 Transcript_33461/m.81013 type:complete len:925 (+) Transcript_33461:372-3146(+)